MKLEDMSDELAKVYISRNGITGAFIWDERPKGWAVYLGDPAEACGWRESMYKTKKEAMQECERLDGQIERLLK